ncbi:hypothetical protein [Arenimonas caeni]|uniref:hypothetical protein n=1 Tax=Arenimonas caeni TaxID=2058085 RepID=UPI0013B05D8E|nr:hypothetical protein [Arenimonas caeni]
MNNKILYSLPFYWFWGTRLRSASVAFHLLFEWGAAVFLILALSGGDWGPALYRGILCYLAFISLYEIGYIINDLKIARREVGGRLRGPQGAHAAWFWTWIATRLSLFAVTTVLLGTHLSLAWWTFFGALAFVFALHNIIADREIKAGTFLWLSWFRFMAPMVFVLPAHLVLGVGLACSMSYSAYRQIGYLDSKGMLLMPGRKRATFRLVFFLWPMAGAVALATFPDALGFHLLTGYFGVIAILGVTFSKAAIWLKSRRRIA